MIDKLRSLMFSNELESSVNAVSKEPETLAAALLLEVAIVDGDFSPGERSIVVKLLEKHFSLDFQNVNNLIDEAREKTQRSIDLFGLTREVNKCFSHDERIELIEMLWSVVYADEVVEDFESNIMRRLTGLLHVSDRDSGEARKKALTQLSL